MSYVLIEDGVVVSTNLPTVGILPDGRKVSNFNRLDQETLKEAGWLPLEEPEPPTHDPNTQEVERIYSIRSDKVVVGYSVKDRPPLPDPEPIPPSTQEQFDALVDALITKGTLTEAEVDQMKEPKIPSPKEPKE